MQAVNKLSAGLTERQRFNETLRNRSWRLRAIAAWITAHRVMLSEWAMPDDARWFTPGEGDDRPSGYYVGDDDDRELATYIDLYVSSTEIQIQVNGAGAKHLMAYLRQRIGGQWKKEYWGETFHLRRKFNEGTPTYFTVDISADRGAVCTRRVVGTKVERVRDPDAPLIERTVDQVEWDCDPILAEDDAA